MTQRASQEPSLQLHDHHARLEAACTDLLADTYADDPRALCARWRWFEDQVAAHMAAEEELILPAYERVAPAEAQAIRDEHRALRALLARLAVEVDLHEIRVQTVRALIDALHAHALREDRSLYPWVRQSLPPPSLSAVRQRVAGWLGLAA